MDKIEKKCYLMGSHYIFSADLTRLTKMFSLSCIYLYILICMQKLLHIGHVHCISFSIENPLWVNINFTCEWCKLKNDNTSSKLSMVGKDLQSIMSVHKCQIICYLAYSSIMLWFDISKLRFQKATFISACNHYYSYFSSLLNLKIFSVQI